MAKLVYKKDTKPSKKQQLTPYIVIKYGLIFSVSLNVLGAAWLILTLLKN